MNKPDAQSEAFKRAQDAFDEGDLNTALSFLSAEVKTHPGNTAAHLLIGSSFIKAGHYRQAFQVFSALILHPEIRGHVELPKKEVDELMVATLLAWGASIEESGFSEEDLRVFQKAVNFYGSGSFSGRFTVELIGLDEGLQRKLPVTETFAQIIAKKN